MPARLTIDVVNDRVMDLTDGRVQCIEYTGLGKAGAPGGTRESVFRCNECGCGFYQKAYSIINGNAPMCACIRNSLHPLRDRVWLVDEQRPPGRQQNRQAPRPGGSRGRAEVTRGFSQSGVGRDLDTLYTMLKRGDTERAISYLETLRMIHGI